LREPQGMRSLSQRQFVGPLIGFNEGEVGPRRDPITWAAGQLTHAAPKNT
jgi:hypothetical protein